MVFDKYPLLETITFQAKRISSNLLQNIQVNLNFFKHHNFYSTKQLQYNPLRLLDLQHVGLI